MPKASSIQWGGPGMVWLMLYLPELSRKRCMLCNQDHASRVNSAAWEEIRCCCCFTLQFWNSKATFFTDYEVSFFLLYLSVTLKRLETFWVRQIKKLEENNHRFASTLIFLTRLLSLLFVYSGYWNYSLYTWRQMISQEAQVTGCHI